MSSSYLNWQIGAVTLLLECVLLPTFVNANVDHVILISVDGLRADLLQNLINNDTNGSYANFKRFVTEGATTFNARTDFTHTITIPNHACMITGRPVLQPGSDPTLHHGYTSNSDPPANWTLHNQGNTNVPYKASVFDVAHDNGLSTALYASKSKFILFEQSYNATNGAPDTTGPDNGRDKIDVYVNKSVGQLNASNMQVDFINGMRANRYNFAFVHYRDPDSVGHDQGWGSGAWNASVADVDDYLGQVFNLIENDVTASPHLNGKTVIILTTDHGGLGTGHSSASVPESYTIPYFVWGTGIPAGADAYSLFPAHIQNPGNARPDYLAPVQPIRTGGAGNHALELLGLNSIPGSSINADIVAPPVGELGNPHFENGTYRDPDVDHTSANSWTGFTVSGFVKWAVPWLGAGAHSPDFVQEFFESNWIAGIRQTVGATSGDIYTASVWTWGASTQAKFWIGIDPTGGTDAASSNIVWSNPANPGSNWTRIEVEAAATASTITIFLKAQNPTGGNVPARFDDADLTSVPGTPRIPADMDNDGDVDLTDFGLFQRCFTGSGVLQDDPTCAGAKLDNDVDVDQDDFGIFQACQSGPNRPANPNCAD